MNLIYILCSNNKLTLNLQKTKAMIVSPKCYDNVPSEKINDVAIEYVHEFKYLGLVIDNRLKFARHALRINRRLSSVIVGSYSLRDCLSISAAKTFYYSMFHSIVTYLIPIWGETSQTVLDLLQRSQNKVVRILFGHLI